MMMMMMMMTPKRRPFYEKKVGKKKKKKSYIQTTFRQQKDNLDYICIKVFLISLLLLLSFWGCKNES